MNYLSYEQYRKLFTVLQGYTAIILLSLGEHSTERLYLIIPCCGGAIVVGCGLRPTPR